MLCARLTKFERGLLLCAMLTCVHSRFLLYACPLVILLPLGFCSVQYLLDSRLLLCACAILAIFACRLMLCTIFIYFDSRLTLLCFQSSHICLTSYLTTVASSLPAFVELPFALCVALCRCNTALLKPLTFALQYIAAPSNVFFCFTVSLCCCSVLTTNPLGYHVFV